MMSSRCTDAFFHPHKSAIRSGGFARRHRQYAAV
jgi:hypothetical protein